jgi:AcrR family transcriptional regulator
MTFVAADHLDDVGNALLRAADTLLATEGASALTVRRIATEAGMSTMNVYSRFGGKDGVVEQLFLQGFALLARAMQQVPTTDDPMRDLSICGDAYRTFALDHATLYAVMFERVVADYVPTPEAQAAALGTLDLLAERLQRTMDAGVLRTMNPTHAAAIVWSTCHGVVSLQLKHLEVAYVDWQRVYLDATAAVIQGLSS